MLVKKLSKLLFFVSFLHLLGFGAISTIQGLPSDEERKGMAQAKRLEDEARKNLSSEDSQKMFAIDDAFKCLLKSMNVDTFFRVHRDNVYRWLQKQNQQDTIVQETLEALNTVSLGDNLQLVMTNQELIKGLMYLAQLRASDDGSKTQEIAEIETVIGSCQDYPQGILDDSFIQLLGIYLQVISSEDENQINEFASQLMMVSSSAVKPLSANFTLIMKWHMDSETLASVKLLKEFYEAQVDADERSDYRIVHPIALKNKPLVSSLVKDITSAKNSFIAQAKSFESIPEKTPDIEKKTKAYRAMLDQLKKYEDIIKNFDEINDNVASKDWNSVKKSAQIVSYTSQAYDFFADFFKLYKDDCMDSDFHGSTEGFLSDNWADRLLLPTLFKFSFFAANSVMYYKVMRNQMSKEVIKPFLSPAYATDYRQQKKDFFQQFGNKVPALEGQIKVPASKAIKVNAAFEVLKHVGKQQVQGFASSSQRLSGLSAMSGGFSYSQLQVRKLIINALYYYTMHQNFKLKSGDSHAGLASYKPWVHDIIETVGWESIKFSHQIESLIYRSMSLHALDKIENFSLGIVTPDIVSKLVSIGKDGILANRSLKSWGDKIAKFDYRIIYGFDFNKKFPLATDGQLFAAYADRELFSYSIGCMAKFLGGHVIKNCSGVLLAGIRKVATWFLGKQAVENYTRGAQGLEIVLTQGLAIILGGPDSKAEKSCEAILEAVEELNGEWVAMAKGFLGFVRQGRPLLLSYFGLREIPGERDQVNEELLERVIYEVFVNNPANVRIITGREIAEIMDIFRKDKNNTRAVAIKIVDMLQKNAVAKLGGALCGKIAEWRAKNYWDNRGKPFIFGRSIA